MKKNNIPKIILSIFFVLIIIICAAYFLIRAQFLPITSQFSENAEEIRIEIPYGMSVYNVAQELEQKKVIRNAKFFYYAARYPEILKILFPKEAKDLHFSLKSGIYHIGNYQNTIEIQKLLSSGQQEYIKVAIPEGLTISKIAAILEENRICTAQDFITVCSTPSVFSTYPISELFDKGLIKNCEGFLFPDTYYLNIGMTAESVTRIMIENFFEKIKLVDNLSEKSVTDLFDTLILASIVEREYRVEDEAPLIASVFKNRLAKNIGLYSCATLEYIITEIQGKPHPDVILISDTKIDNPYNTYKWAGLPPGPISNPGLTALNAATNTPSTGYYFFQVINPAEGRHVFTSTFEEHKVNHLYTKSAAGK